MDKAYPVTRPEKSAGVKAFLVITRDALTIELIKAMMGQCPCTNIAIMVEGTSVTALIKSTDTACINTLVDLSEQEGNEFEFLEVRAAKEVPLTVQILVKETVYTTQSGSSALRKSRFDPAIHNVVPIGAHFVPLRL